MMSLVVPCSFFTLIVSSAGPPHKALMCENEHFDGTWDRIKPDLYRHQTLTFSDKGGKVYISQVDMK